MPDAKCKRERKKKKKVTNIISFDDEEDEQSSGDVFKKIPGAGVKGYKPNLKKPDRVMKDIQKKVDEKIGQ